MVEESVHRGSGEERVGEESGEFVDVAVGGDDEGALLVALADDLVEVEGLLTDEGTEAEVIDHEDVDLGESGETALVGAVASPCAKLTKQLLGEDVLGGEAAPTSDSLAVRRPAPDGSCPVRTPR